MMNDNIVPVGSTTNSWTATGIMRLYQEGKLGLNDTIDKHVNEYLERTNGTNIA